VASAVSILLGLRSEWPHEDRPRKVSGENVVQILIAGEMVEEVLTLGKLDHRELHELFIRFMRATQVNDTQRVVPGRVVLDCIQRKLHVTAVSASSPLHSAEREKQVQEAWEVD
jgi:hypothetical protein